VVPEKSSGFDLCGHGFVRRLGQRLLALLTLKFTFYACACQIGPTPWARKAWIL
jgi:hypothetical protein